ncbi:bis(5'-nucleosyl)-tetraphosphatase (symmetrical) YqeK [Sutcliffiella horikoshii]|uniref:bis(5'-nucleosyl)-tetraphosphatase (symmetrical) YqeK n=1 Tax=Sutcliffiella horikoshii TaxID=79883 RepID=UPI002041D014|nr:bis(5'-nucleosyl)-tetraphosphatase (symmetrical) YqeK [Sutcliffiella horikoshii]MCM3619138.1 bis(5'-nucleosyl)-tetraphosphatase (symmetrical) YqeK [Sutcliffiella horikoshii]
MNREKALRLVKDQLTERRYVHTLGVVETAIRLAEVYKVDVQKAELAAIFHDYAKFRDKEEMRQIIIDQKMPQDLLQHHDELWHAPVGSYLVEKEAGVSDPEVLEAIRCHTSGKINMSSLDKVLYLADYIEPGRDFPGVQQVRDSAETSLDIAVIQAMKNTISFLLKRNQPIYPDTFHAYNDMTMKVKERKLT